VVKTETDFSSDLTLATKDVYSREAERQKQRAIISDIASRGKKEQTGEIILTSKAQPCAAHEAGAWAVKDETPLATLRMPYYNGCLVWSWSI
jgi:hypothetical protein